MDAFDIATAAGLLGRREEAQVQLHALAKINPEMLNPEYARPASSRWVWYGDLIDLRVDGLQKALALAGVESTPADGDGADSPLLPD